MLEVMGVSAERLRVMSLVSLRLLSLNSIVRQMRRTIPKVRVIMPVGITNKEMRVAMRAVRRKRWVFLSSATGRPLTAMTKGRIKAKRKERTPIKPVVVIRVKRKVLDSEKRMLQLFLSRLR